MSFNEPSFLFLFLPAVLLLYFVIPRRLPSLRNALLLLASVVFYLWGGKEFVFVLVGATAVNYAVALAIEAAKGTRRAKTLLGLVVAADLGLLVYTKYSRFVEQNIEHLLGAAGSAGSLQSWVYRGAVPLGVSFFTFSAISYVVDVYRGDAKAERSFLRAALFVSFFPKIVAGPIARYRDLSGQLGERVVTRADFAAGVRRFLVGMAKKVVVSSAVALPADKIFAIPVGELTPSLAWLGLICYTVQIYFDFSGYTDMAIGAGQMFGFKLTENFNYPYIADSIRDFWRRWHMSLSSWLRDYLFIPLGGSRVAEWRVYFNLVTVFVLCGLWHGASWGFIVWGLYYGVFLVLERVGLGDLLEAAWKPVRHVYALAVIMGGWVFFRADTPGQALGYLGAMIGVAGGHGVQDDAAAYVDALVVLAIVLGVIGSTPVLPWLNSRIEAALAARRSAGTGGAALEMSWVVLSLVTAAALILIAGMLIAANTYSPFIYRQF